MSKHTLSIVKALGTLGLAALLMTGVGCDGGKGADKGDKGGEKPAAGAGSAPAKGSASAPAKGSASAPAKGPASAPVKDISGKASVHFVWPQDGAKIFEASKVIFGLTGKSIHVAGEKIDDQNLGHHHLIIDGKPIEKGKVVPADDQHIHFGKGQTETDVVLKPGKHTLTMQFADGAHRSYGPDMSATINVEVVAAEAERKVFFVEPADGAKVKGPVKVKFGISGMKVQPAGEAPLDKTTGHHHIIVNGEPMPLAKVVPADEKHIHFGKGQTEAELKLPPGKHKLTMQLADGAHRSYGPNMSSTISIEVTE